MVPAIWIDPQNPELGKVFVVINPEEWSAVETAPIPATIPDLCFAVIYGEDPAAPLIEVFFTEEEAKQSSSSRNNSFGYVPIAFLRNAMIPTK